MFIPHYPLLEGDNSTIPSPPEYSCPACGLGNVNEPNSFVALAGGCYRNQKAGSPKADGQTDAFLSIWWHGAHDGGVGVHEGHEALVRVADNVSAGQFSFYFCSPACLRIFLNRLVDDLEREIGVSERVWD